MQTQIFDEVAPEFKPVRSGETKQRESKEHKVERTINTVRSVMKFIKIDLDICFASAKPSSL
jgi:hypothetical protein